MGETICRAQGRAAETTQPKLIYFKTGFEHNPAPAKKRERHPSHEWESGAARARQSQAHEQDYGNSQQIRLKKRWFAGQTDSDQPQSESESDAEIHDVLSEQGTDEDLLREMEGELDEEEHSAVAVASSIAEISASWKALVMKN